MKKERDKNEMALGLFLFRIRYIHWFGSHFLFHLSVAVVAMVGSRADLIVAQQWMVLCPPNQKSKNAICLSGTDKGKTKERRNNKHRTMNAKT